MINLPALHADQTIFAARMAFDSSLKKGGGVKKHQRRSGWVKEVICCFASYLSSKLPAGIASLSCEKLSMKDPSFLGFASIDWAFP